MNTQELLKDKSGIILYIFLINNKNNKKTQTDNELILITGSYHLAKAGLILLCHCCLRLLRTHQ